MRVSSLLKRARRLQSGRDRGYTISSVADLVLWHSLEQPGKVFGPTPHTVEPRLHALVVAATMRRRTRGAA